MSNQLSIKPKLSKKRIKTYRKYILSPNQQKDLHNLKSNLNEKQQLNQVNNKPQEPESIDSEWSGVLHSSTNWEEVQRIPCFETNKIMPNKVEFTIHQDLKNYWFDISNKRIHQEENAEEMHADNLEAKLKSDRSQAKGMLAS